MFWLSALLIFSPFFIGWIVGLQIFLKGWQAFVAGVLSLFSGWLLGSLVIHFPQGLRLALVLMMGLGLFLIQTQLQRLQHWQRLLTNWLLISVFTATLLPFVVDLSSLLPDFQLP